MTTGAPPTPMSGTLVDGTYNLVSLVNYNDPAVPGETKATIVVQGGGAYYDWASITEDTGYTTTTHCGALAVENGMLNFYQMGSSNPSPSYAAYTATPTSIEVHREVQNGTFVLTFAKQ